MSYHIDYKTASEVIRSKMEKLSKSSIKASGTDSMLDAIRFFNERIEDLYEQRRDVQERILKTCTHPAKFQKVEKYEPEDTLGNFCTYTTYTYFCVLCDKQLFKENI